ncbi:hypothetical protein [uncultured Rikenella sp.]|uniref:hypothetical protein n=1 Tax=uncultured Rikenella sp. TaxID=368003 RepID=UPI0025DBD509|nr:hypothetical protein [uncultured Rikenella sp.]
MISYFSSRARVELCAGQNCSFCEQKEPKKLQSASLRDALAGSARLSWIFSGRAGGAATEGRKMA